MKFVLAETSRYWWPVAVRVPDPGNPGQFIAQEFEVLFEPAPSETDTDTILREGELEGARAIARAEREALASICRDWRGVVDDSRKEIPFTEEAFAAALKLIWFRRGVFEAYAQSLRGEAARLGN